MTASSSNGDSKSVDHETKRISPVFLAQSFFSTHWNNQYAPVVSLIAGYITDDLPEWVVQYKNQPEKVAATCLAYLKETKHNGVACALQLLTPEEEKTLCDAWRKSSPDSPDSLLHRFLCAYYSHRNEWGELEKMIEEYLDQAKNPASCGMPACINECTYS